MKGMQKFALLAVSALTLATVPSPMATPYTATAAPAVPAEILVAAAPVVVDTDPVTGTLVDATIKRSAAPTSAPAVTRQNSGGGVGVLGGAKCIVKFFRPVELVTRRHSSRHEEPVILAQNKLICNDAPGFTEVVLEQNDRLVVGGTTQNDQTGVTLHSLTTKLNREQGETFCYGSLSAIGGAQTCVHDLGW